MTFSPQPLRVEERGLERFLLGAILLDLLRENIQFFLQVIPLGVQLIHPCGDLLEKCVTSSVR